MPARWTRQEEKRNRRELFAFYVAKNKTIGEIASILNITDSGVYDRLIRLDIPVNRNNKPKANNRNLNIKIPKKSVQLAEFVGMLCGDGSLTPTQVTVTLGKKDQYVPRVMFLMKTLFNSRPKCSYKKSDDVTVYFGSVEAVRFFLAMGLVYNKVAAQVDAPAWIFEKKDYMKAWLRGFFDTDGSIYKLRWGTQIEFTNHSMPLLHSTKKMLLCLGYQPSKVSGPKLYITRKENIRRFFNEIRPKNTKHVTRYQKFTNSNGRVA